MQRSILTRKLLRTTGVSVRNLSTKPQLTVTTLNNDLRKAEYAVRGEIVIKALQHVQALKRKEARPFDKVIFCNIGNPQELGQKPMTWAREVFAAVNCPELLDQNVFKADVAARAKEYLDNIAGGTGAYTNSQGLDIIRGEVADFIGRRDGFPSNPANIFLTDGASPAVQMCIRALLRSPSDAIMIPIPQYPLYSASIALYGGSQVGYYLDEDSNWGMQMNELERSLSEAKAAGKEVRALTVINPGNPTGNCLAPENMREVVDFCVKHNLILLADEVYQENIWDEHLKFVSFKQVASEMGVVDPESKSAGNLQLISYHSTSKGFFGECGRRGGYMELIGFPEDVKMELYKLASVSLCSNTGGQLMVGLMVNPPRAGDPSYESFEAERTGILSSLRRRALKLSDAFNKLDGVSCQTPQGALYTFPSITLPPRAIDAATKMGKAADAMYCLELLDSTGVVVVPGSGFGQRPGTFHFRSTILPSEDEIDSVINRMSDFHSAFLHKYRH